MASKTRGQHIAAEIEGKKRKTYDLRQVEQVERDFYARDPRIVSRELLGKVMVRNVARERLAGRIVEVEAYLGADDAAAHAAAGLTARTRVIFGPPGHAYVYFIYGNYYCLNVTCMPEGQAGSVLFRALEPLYGLETMARYRGIVLEAPLGKARRLLTTGPGRLCQALNIDRLSDNGADMTTPQSGLWVGDDGFRPQQIVIGKRVGITKSAEQPLRYYIAENEFVSRPIPKL